MYSTDDVRGEVRPGLPLQVRQDRRGGVQGKNYKNIDFLLLYIGRTLRECNYKDQLGKPQKKLFF